MKVDNVELVNRIDYLLKLNHMTRKQMAEILGRRTQIFSDWKTIGYTPSIEDIYTIAKTLNVPIDYLVEGFIKTPEPDLEDIVVNMRFLTAEERKPIYDLIIGQVNYWRKVYNK